MRYLIFFFLLFEENNVVVESVLILGPLLILVWDVLKAIDKLQHEEIKELGKLKESKE